MSSASQAIFGLDVVLEQPDLLAGRRYGLLTSSAAVTADLRRGLDALVAADVPPHRIIGPEHGYWGTAQAGLGGTERVDAPTGIPVISSYQVDGGALDDLLRGSGIDAVVVDLQDIGVRFYTYLWSLFDVMSSCARIGLPLTVLDRPAPLPTDARGPGLDPAFSSFVGRRSIPLRHGSRLGGLARHLATCHVPEPLDLRVIDAPGTDGEAPWVPTSPNMPTRTTVALYPGTGLLEGTTWSEGRGTTLPFELLGAPWSGPELAGVLREKEQAGLLPGVRVREAVWTPTSGDMAGERLHGVQLHLLEEPVRAVRETLDPIRIGHTVLTALHALQPRGVELWRRSSPQGPFFLDLLWGSAALREGIQDGASLEQILAASPPAPAVGAAPDGVPSPAAVSHDAAEEAAS